MGLVRGKLLLAKGVGFGEIPPSNEGSMVEMKGELFLAGSIGAGLRAGWPAQLVAEPTAQPEAHAQTAPVPHEGDAADDPAVWIHPQEPSLSLILGTDKQ